MAPLLSFGKQQEIKPISANNEAKYLQLALEVESLELDKLLGSAFYQAISTTPANYTDLLNGSSFTDDDNNTITHRGLRYVIAYLNYAKYIGESYITDTYSGFRQKLNADSERISSGDIKRLQQDNREIAFNAFELVREFLNNANEADPTAYPLWKSTNERRTYKPIFYGIKKTLG